MNRTLGGLVVLAAALSSCDREDQAPRPVTITIAGSTAVAPLLKDAAARYRKQNGFVSFDLNTGGSHVGLEKVAKGEVMLGASDVVAEGPLARGLVDHRVAVVGFAVMANKGMFNESITSLSREDVVGIFTGKLTNWAQVGGDDEPIVVVNREKGSGSRAAFAALALKGAELVPGVERDGSHLVQEELLHHSGAISYLAIAYEKPDLKVFAYDGISPTEENIKAGSYQLWSYEHLYTKGPAPDHVTAFLSFLSSGRYSREVLPGLGFIPLNDMRVVRDEI